MGKQRLSKRDIKQLNEQLPLLELSKKAKVENEDGLLLLEDKPALFYYAQRPVPHLKLLLEKDLLKSVQVDMPAIKFLINGADVMRPGIVQIDPAIEENELVTVKDEQHQKPICVGIALCSGKEMQEKDSGKVIKNIHYVGDALWKR